MKKLATVIALAAAFSSPVWAATKTVTLSVPGMYCPVCPITVKKALAKVDGVTKTEVNLDKRQATVTYNDAKTNVKALTNATRDAGYPSTLVQ
ncbi:MAG TPA: mercury resistance system periplasmic binding protein MerP [Burkholderiales bacterium]|nr:mercury resistance system periplasmic binding protein MerP [Burkholderiales bacterium]